MVGVEPFLVELGAEPFGEELFEFALLLFECFALGEELFAFALLVACFALVLDPFFEAGVSYRLKKKSTKRRR